MKYRPLGSTGAAVSSLCLCIGDEQFAKGPAALKTLIIAGLEAGINAYHFEIATTSLLEAAGEALSHVDRDLLWISLTVGGPRSQSSVQRSFDPDDLTRTVEEGLHTSGLGWFDVAVLDDPAEDELPFSSLTTLKALRSSSQVRMLGIKGEAPVMNTYLSTGAFDALYTPFSVNSDWTVRARMREAQKRNMLVFIYDYDRDVRRDPKTTSTLPRKKPDFLTRIGLKKAPPPVLDPSLFGFLHTTQGWTASELCLGMSLTDPQVCSALINAQKPSDIEPLCQVTERHLPSRLAAQIEMARVGGAQVEH